MDKEKTYMRYREFVLDYFKDQERNKLQDAEEQKIPQQTVQQTPQQIDQQKSDEYLNILSIFISYLDTPLTILEILRFSVKSKDTEMMAIFSKIPKYEAELTKLVVNEIKEKDNQIVRMIDSNIDNKVKAFYAACEYGNRELFYQYLRDVEKIVNMDNAFELASEGNNTDMMYDILHSEKMWIVTPKSIENLIKHRNSYMLVILTTKELKLKDGKMVPYVVKDVLLGLLKPYPDLKFSVVFHSSGQNILGKNNNPFKYNAKNESFMEYYRGVSLVFYRKTCKDITDKIVSFV